MTTYSIRQIGDPVLRQKADDVTEIDGALADNAHTMIETMYAAPGIGLAATQVDWHVRLVIIDVSKDNDAREVFINPEILEAEGRAVGEEGCLSVPGMRGIVPRFVRLHYTGFDQYSQPIDRLVSGFHARVVQHECDHLDGILYPMRIQDLTQFGYTDVLFPDSDIADD